MQSPFSKFTESPVFLKMVDEVVGNASLMIKEPRKVVAVIDPLEIKLNHKNDYNNLALAFIKDCIAVRYKITESMILAYFSDHGLNWVDIKHKMALTGDKNVDYILRCLKHRPELIRYSTCGKLVILK
jgi:hypothetical protein